MKITRDSVVWWLVIVAAVATYLGNMPPPSDWTWSTCWQALAAIAAVIAGKLATSPLPGAPKDDQVSSTTSRRYVWLLPLLLAALLPAAGCATFARQPSAEQQAAKLVEIERAAGILEQAGLVAQQVQQVEIAAHQALPSKITDADHRAIQQGFLDVSRAVQVALAAMRDVSADRAACQQAVTRAVVAVNQLIDQRVIRIEDTSLRIQVQTGLAAASAILGSVLLLL